MRPRPPLSSFLVVLALSLIAPGLAEAQTLYWDINGTAAGASNAGSATGTWDTTAANWNTVSTGIGATTTYTSGATPVFSAGTDTTTAAITVNGAQTVGGRMLLEEGAYTFSGDNLTFTGGNTVFLDSTTGPTTINNTLVLTAASTTGGNTNLTKAAAGNLTFGNIAFDTVADANAAGQKAINFIPNNAGAVITFNGTVTTAVGGTATSRFIIGGSSSNIGTLGTPSSTGQVIINGDNSNVTGGGQINIGIALIGNNRAFGAGSINIGGGALTSGNTAQLLTNGAFTVANNLTFGSGGVADSQAIIGGNTADVSTFSGTVSVNSAVQSPRFSAVAGGRVNFTGVISGATTGQLDVIKQGAGILAFTNSNTYVRNTQVNAGTLLANGTGTGTTSSATGTGTVTVNNAGTILGGTGRILGAVTVNSGATLQGGEGPAATGTLTLQVNPTLAADSVLGLTLGVGNTHSSITLATGGFSGFQANQAFTLNGLQPGIYDNVITGVASGIDTSNWTVTNGAGFSYRFTDDGTNIDLSVTAVPEPSTWAAGVFCIGAISYALRRRCHQA